MDNIFDDWNEHKKMLDENHHIPTFKPREIWWASIGINVGHEQNGKGKRFNRPVLVVRKFNHRLFWGVPLSTQIKSSLHYHQFSFMGKPQSALLTQLRLWDGTRLTHKMGRLAEKEFLEISAALKNYLP